MRADGRISFRFAVLPRDGEGGICVHTPKLPGVLGSQDRAWKCPHGCAPYIVPVGEMPCT